MDYIDIINKKEKNKLLSYNELDYIFTGYLNNNVSDIDMTRILKAICKYGLTEEETFYLTDIFINSGSVIDLSNLGTVVDKHSTGGVGDKITLIIGPIVASLGIKIAKMSGRALGHTGGTIDKLESIIGFNVNLNEKDFIDQIKKINIAITSQTANVVPMDKKIYALRDITDTTMSIPLIASSIMSKKIACGADKILIDVKVGKGALIKDIKQGEILSQLMIKIGKKYKKKVICILTNMNIPLGNNIGNGLEILEVIEILNNKGNPRLKELSIKMACLLVAMGKNIDVDDSLSLVIDSLESGKAYEKFKELVTYQKGDLNNIIINPNKKSIYSKKSGFINKIDALKIGLLSSKLGAGRKTKEDLIDYGSGIVLNKNIGDFIKKGELLCDIYTSNDFDINEVYKCFKINKYLNENDVLIYKVIE